MLLKGIEINICKMNKRKSKHEPMCLCCHGFESSVLTNRKESLYYEGLVPA